jgi:hypothetical protein
MSYIQDLGGGDVFLRSIQDWGGRFSYVTPNGIVFLAILRIICHFSLGVEKTLLSISF